TEDSCSAAAAVTLLSLYDIRSDEAEMAALCLTRERFGTTPLGLYRGLTLKSRPHELSVRVVHCNSVVDLARLARRSIITVGLNHDSPPDVVARMESFGWAKGVHHDVAVIDVDPDGQWIDVADPSNGLERWPAEDLLPIWGRFALILERR